MWRNLDKTLFAQRRAPEPGRGQRVAVAFWRSLATIFGVAALGAGAFIAVLLIKPEAILPPQMPLVAAIVGDDGAIMLARVRPDGVLVAEPFSPTLAVDRDPELWVIFEGMEPISLGVMTTSGLTSVSVSAVEALGLQGARLVVTDEPAGGSPSGKPTGPAVAEGALRQI